MCSETSLVARPISDVVFTVLLLQMLAMKFLHYQQDHSSLLAAEEETDKAATKGPPASLLQLAAEMIKVCTQ